MKGKMDDNLPGERFRLGGGPSQSVRIFHTYVGYDIDGGGSLPEGKKFIIITFP
jgi:hypothetical protein